jgi:hypothetical protein
MISTAWRMRRLMSFSRRMDRVNDSEQHSDRIATRLRSAERSYCAEPPLRVGDLHSARGWRHARAVRHATDDVQLTVQPHGADAGNME